MSEKSEFQELRSKIARYLRERILRTKPEIRDEERPADPKPTLRNPVFKIPQARSVRPKEENPALPNGRLDAVNIAAYRKRIQDGFDKTKTATTPWIKLGIDLGTSSSKVVWRGESNVFPVCFDGDPLMLESYLEPSLVTFKGANLLFGFDAIESSKHSTVSNFKMCLACVSRESGGCKIENCSLTTWPIDLFCAELKNQEIQFVNATHLGKLIAKAKRIIISELSGTFRKKPVPKWTANLAVPEVFIEQSPVADEFKRILRTGWLMSEIFIKEPKLKNRRSLFECFVAAREVSIESLGVLSDEEFGCSIYPEVGAEVASIVMSRLSEEGLYAFVDIGAGTVDASLFKYFRRDGKSNRPPFAADVSKDLGASQLEVRASRETVSNKSLSTFELKRIKEIYNGLSETERLIYAEQFERLKRVVHEMKPRIQSFLQSIFRDARNGKDSNIVNSKIRLVIGGGGSHLNFYKQAAISAFTIKHATSPIAPEQTTLQKPVDFQMSLPEDQFHRFAVAYGLSFPIEDLPEMVFPKNVKPKELPKPRQRDYGSIYEK